MEVALEDPDRSSEGGIVELGRQVACERTVGERLTTISRSTEQAARYNCGLAEHIAQVPSKGDSSRSSEERRQQVSMSQQGNQQRIRRHYLTLVGKDPRD
jgi:hypothetical protein